MKRIERRGEHNSLRPIGAALAAVVAGIGVAQGERPPERPNHAPLEPASQGNTYFVDPTNHAGFDEDPSLVFGASEPTEVLGAQPAKPKQKDFFDL